MAICPQGPVMGASGSRGTLLLCMPGGHWEERRGRHLGGEVGGLHTAHTTHLSGSGWRVIVTGGVRDQGSGSTTRSEGA